MIGEVIRTYRKKKGMTQEEIANRLGVTTPAVNKWENGNSYPDISLLAPLARLLEISTDTLLSYREELTEQEVVQVLGDLGTLMKDGDYEKAYRQTVSLLLEYPNCEELMLSAAQMLDAYRLILKPNDSGEYEETILSYYERILESKNSDYVQTAQMALATFYMNKEDYDKAWEYVECMPKQSIQPSRIQAVLYKKKGERRLSYELFEKMLYSAYGDIAWALNGIWELCMEEKLFEKGDRILEKQKEIARLLEMGAYHEQCPYLSKALWKQDAEECFFRMNQLIDSLNSLAAYRESELYSHMQFSDYDGSYMVDMLLRGWEHDEEIGFLKEDKRYQQILERLREMPNL